MITNASALRSTKLPPRSENWSADMEQALLQQTQRSEMLSQILNDFVHARNAEFNQQKSSKTLPAR